MATIPTTSVIDSAIVTVREDLDRVRQIKKCTSCECLLDVLEAIRADLTDVASARAQATRADFGTWWEAGNVKRHRSPLSRLRALPTHRAVQPAQRGACWRGDDHDGG